MIADRDAEKLLDLIYDASVDNDLWRAVLTRIADATGSQGGIMIGLSVRAQTVYFDFNGRLSEEHNRIFQERHQNNIFSQYMQHQPVGRVVFSDEFVALDQLRKTAWYDEVLRPQDIAHACMVPLAAKNGFQVAFNICRSPRRGAFDADERNFSRDWCRTCGVRPCSAYASTRTRLSIAPPSTCSSINRTAW